MIKKLLYKNPIKFCISFFVIGIIVGFTISVIAESINSDEVLYDNSNSSSNSDNVQDVLDDLYSIYNRSGLGYSLLTKTPVGLSNTLEGGLYRYQGIQDTYNNVDNYICFGTTDKSLCTSDTDKYMYRIIGIDTGGKMKLIKKEALNTAYKWNSTGGVDWAHCDLFNGLNGSYFLENTVFVPDNTWKNRIANTEWHYGDVTNGDYNAATMADIELSLPNTVSAKIGLMYLHDYYYGLPGGTNCNANGSTCSGSWIFLSKNDSEPPKNIEWLMPRQQGTWAWLIHINNGTAAANMYSGLSSVYDVRPVFFLNASETISSGNGTIDDPYILS